MRFLGRVAVIGAGVFLAQPCVAPEAEAQLVTVCPTCASSWDSIQQTALGVKAQADRALAYVRQGQQYVMQGRQFANQVQNTIQIPRYVWMNVQQDMRTVQSILGSGPHYGLSSGFNIQTLGSYASYLGQAVDMPSKYGMWSDQANSNVASIMRGLGTQQDQLVGDQANLSGAQQMVTISEGQVQAIQSHAMLTSQVAGEVQKLRQIELARAQMELNRLAVENDQRVLSQAQMTQFMSAPAPSMNGGLRY